MTDEDAEFSAANDKRHRKLLARRLRANGFVRHSCGFWLAPDAALDVPSQPDESDEANERKPV